MKGSELFTRLCSIVGTHFLRAVQRTGLLGALCTLILLVSCGKSSDPMGPSVNSGRSASAATVQPTSDSAPKLAAFATSELDLIQQTSGGSGWVTILSAPIRTVFKGGLFVNASLETGLFTQALTRAKNNRKDASTGSVAVQVQTVLDGQAVSPGVVTFAARTQTLSSTLEGAIGGCVTTVTNPDGTTSIVVDQNCVTPEEI